MATRNQNLVVPQQQRGAVVKKQKAVVGKGEVKGRPALNNISNNVENVNRPITRSFGAKLLANAQAQAVAAPNKKPLTLPSDNQAAPRVPAPRPASKKQVKPVLKQNEIINLDSDSDPDKGTKPMSISDPRSKKREVHSLTSVLSARSKIACGISEKPSQHIDEIDLPDVNNQLAVVEYVEDLYTFYKQQQHVCRPIDYMHNQLDINPKMRAILVDWIMEVHHKFELMPETLYLTIYIVDRYLSLEYVARRQLQLVGMCAMLIACKYEEIWAPEVSDFIHIADSAYTREEILGKEKEILNKLEWYLTVPTAYMFLVRFVKAAKADKELEHMIYFFAELGLMQYNLIQFCPSMVAASAVYAALCTLKKSPLWTDTLKRHTSYSEDQLMECTQVLVNAHIAAPDSKLRVVYKKYMLEQFGGVARYPPAMSGTLPTSNEYD
ncbi:Cyclin family protein [Rhynchospora pubera]|uniref:Cyclin family protein n=1 Tax=Rhynchospora pubera TaxID=906938 RepID=A0AAV8DJX3_9POAL|nr:Cyclin family protein [Rhynchospora pubera]